MQKGIPRIPGGMPGSESRTRDINRIGTAVDGCDADISVSRRGEEFERTKHYLFRASIICLAWAPYLASEAIF